MQSTQSFTNGLSTAPSRTAPHPIRRVLWAVNPFVDKPKLQIQAVRALKSLSQAFLETEIEPVYIVPDEELDFSVTTLNSTLTALDEPAEQNLLKLLRRTKHETKPPRFLTQKGHSIKRGVAELCAYIRESNADLVIVSTHAHKGMTRFWSGSFTERLLACCSVPVLVVSPQAEVPKRVARLLFPSDLRDESFSTFEKVVDIAAQCGAEVFLLHQELNDIPEAVFPFTLPTVSELPGDEGDEMARLRANQWTAAVADRGVEIKLHLSHSMNGVLDAILRTAENVHDSLIALQKGQEKFWTKLLGNLPKEVMHQARRPVLILPS